jgi:hypothetical protein
MTTQAAIPGWQYPGNYDDDNPKLNFFRAGIKARHEKRSEQQQADA